MKKSFNSYGQSATEFGGSVPVWCGTVTPVPYGAVLDAAYVLEGALYKAGTPVEYDAANRTFKPMKNAEDTSVNPNGYLYNDIYIDAVAEGDENLAATGAIVMHHAEGLLIDRTDFASVKDQLQAKVPGVLLVSGI